MNKAVIVLLAAICLLTGCSGARIEPGIVQTVSILKQNETYDPLLLVEYDRSKYDVEVEENTINTAIPKDYDVTYIITEKGKSGNSVRKTFTFSVADDIAPQLIGDRSTITLPQGTIFRISDYFKAVDEREGDLTENISYTGTLDTFLPGEYDLEVTVSDKFGNSAARELKIIVTDNGSSYLSTLLGSYTDVSYTAGQSPVLQIREDGSFILYINNCSLVNNVQGRYLVYDNILYITSDQHAFGHTDEENLAMFRIKSDGSLVFSSELSVCAPNLGDVFSKNIE